VEFGIKNKVAMVAAASKGIGLAAALALAREGARLSICGTTPAHLEKAKKRLGRRHRAYLCDVSSLPQMERWLALTKKDLGPPSILVTNTGGPPAGALGQMSEEQWKAGFENTLLNVVRLVRLVYPGMKRAKWGRIVHVTSLVAKDPEPLLPISSTLRAGLLALTRLQAKEMGPDGITVNCLLPGHTETDRQRHLLEIRAKKQGVSIEAAREQTASLIPLRRLARPEEIGAAVCFLCSQPAGYVSGASLVVDGAFSRGLG
jgi:3-oxoacyl-[acyl-carrier protein] reductase